MERHDNLPTNLKLLRTRKRMTQTALGLKIGVSVTTVSKFETGKMEVPSSTLVKICEALHVSSDELLGIRPGKSLDVEGLTERQISGLSYMVQVLREDNK